MALEVLDERNGVRVHGGSLGGVVLIPSVPVSGRRICQVHAGVGKSRRATVSSSAGR